jgi:hypothetical protein
VVVAACSTAVPVPPAAGLSDARDPGRAWAAVLRRFVDEEGRVDFAGLAADRGDLDTFVAWVARVGPASAPATFPTREDRLACHLNAYNALAMYNVVDAGIPETLAGLRKVPFLFLREVQVGGERMSLHAYENRVIRPLGEERVRFALNCMARGCPRLPRASFTAAGLEPELDRETPRLSAEGRNLAVDAGRKRVRVSKLLRFYAEDFLARPVARGLRQPPPRRPFHPGRLRGRVHPL